MKLLNEDMQSEVVTLTEAIKRLKDARKQNLMVELVKVGKESYLIPMSFAPLVVGSQSEGKLYEHATEGKPLTPPEILVEEVQLEWIGAPLAIVTDSWVAKGYRMIAILLEQPPWGVNPPTTMTIRPQYSLDDAIYYDDDADETLINPPVLDNAHGVFILYFSPDPLLTASGFPIGELAPYMRINVSGIGGTPTGICVISVLGVM